MGTTKRVVQGAILLTIAGLLSKILSAVYRIPLQNLTGDVGFYIYQQVYPIIGSVMILSLYGFPVAISKLTAEAVHQNKPITFRHFYVPLFIILLLINSFFFFITFLAAPYIAEWTLDVQLTKAFQLAAFLFLLIPFLALLRGVFQGIEEMKQIAYSQVIEQIIRVLVIVSVAYLIYIGEINIYKIGEAGVLASLAGMVVALIVLIIFFMRTNDVEKSTSINVQIPWRRYLYICLSLGLVASLNHMILILIQLVDVLTLVPNLIIHGLSPTSAMEAKGVFDRGQPLIQLGIVFGSSFALALVPAVVRERTTDKKELYQSIEEAIGFSFYIASGATLGLMVILREVNLLLFTNTDGTGSLQILVMSILLTSIAITGSAILQSLSFTKYIALWIVFTFMIKWVFNKLFVPFWGISGSAFATVFSLLLLCMGVMLTLHKKLPGLSLFKSVRWRAFILASGGMGLYLTVVKLLLSPIVGLSRVHMIFIVPFLVLSGALIYLRLLVRYDAFTDKQIQALPFASVIFECKKTKEL